jgi:hypothetical protein
MVREKIVWQYIGFLDANTTANFDSLPMDGFDFVRLSYVTHGAGDTRLVFTGGIALPSGYQEKDGNIANGLFQIGNDCTQILNLTSISGFTMQTFSQKCSIILQGIKYEPC